MTDPTTKLGETPKKGSITSAIYNNILSGDDGSLVFWGGGEGRGCRILEPELAQCSRILEPSPGHGAVTRRLKRFCSIARSTFFTRLGVRIFSRPPPFEFPGTSKTKEGSVDNARKFPPRQGRRTDNFKISQKVFVGTCIRRLIF